VAKHIFLTGNPGCGKTTVIVRLAEMLRKAQAPVAGFFTEEIREHGRRVGFGIRTLAGGAGVMSHVGIGSPYRVSKYGVDVPAFERLALPALSPSGEAKKVFLIDEIGKMEIFSEKFVNAVERLLDADDPVVATIALHGGGAIGRIRSRADATLITVTPMNRDALPSDLFQKLTDALKGVVQTEIKTRERFSL